MQIFTKHLFAKAIWHLEHHVEKLRFILLYDR